MHGQVEAALEERTVEREGLILAAFAADVQLVALILIEAMVSS